MPCRHSTIAMYVQPLVSLFYFETVVSINCAGRSWKCSSPASASQVTGITGLCHQVCMTPLFLPHLIWPLSYLAENKLLRLQ